ncbi:MAG: hypothetical protein IJM02_06040, partial [Clostridia bacterium]|nr:hypothetical protein [Clostridia bacterium]
RSFFNAEFRIKNAELWGALLHYYAPHILYGGKDVSLPYKILRLAPLAQDDKASFDVITSKALREENRRAKTEHLRMKAVYRYGE